jgi:hypothetical protein
LRNFVNVFCYLSSRPVGGQIFCFNQMSCHVANFNRPSVRPKCLLMEAFSLEQYSNRWETFCFEIRINMTNRSQCYSNETFSWCSSLVAAGRTEAKNCRQTLAGWTMLEDGSRHVGLTYPAKLDGGTWKSNSSISHVKIFRRRILVWPIFIYLFPAQVQTCWKFRLKSSLQSPLRRQNFTRGCPLIYLIRTRDFGCNI